MFAPDDEPSGESMHRTLRDLARGEDVRAAQRLLNRHGARIATDGVFGEETGEAVRELQRRDGLAVTGIVDAATWAALLR